MYTHGSILISFVQTLLMLNDFEMTEWVESFLFVNHGQYIRIQSRIWQVFSFSISVGANRNIQIHSNIHDRIISIGPYKLRAKEVSWTFPTSVLLILNYSRITIYQKLKSLKTINKTKLVKIKMPDELCKFAPNREIKIWFIQLHIWLPIYMCLCKPSNQN